MLHRSWAIAQLSPNAEAVTDAQAGLDAWCDTGARLHIPTWSCLVAEVAMAVDDFNHASASLATGQAAANRTGEVWMLPEWYRLQANAILHKRQRVPAAKLLRRAITTAQSYSAHWFVLRAARDLTCVQIEQQDSDTDVELLREAIAQCADGSDCTDAQEAREISDRLR